RRNLRLHLHGPIICHSRRARARSTRARLVRSGAALALAAEVAGDGLVRLEGRERVALGALAAREPADRRHPPPPPPPPPRPAYRRQGGVDVVGRHVDDRPALAFL